MASRVAEPRVVVRGDVPNDLVSYARDEMMRFVSKVGRPVLDLELRLLHDADPARDRPCHAELAVDLGGIPVRGRAAARTMREAIDLAMDRLERRVRATTDRARSRLVRHRDATSWHHGDGLTEGASPTPPTAR